ncbi:inactive serine protease PAMR1 isoform X3 [Triplophysa dalaica]|uniref:inactive serine protease PAMR1 isoform X3 n=1 Tax=Triplophysa dalaica TaxID=1582913 RepID=UPI0024E02546|nr:inactive serine protease PAMR1 isoform X3 [Triplophysa dalaica]
MCLSALLHACSQQACGILSLSFSSRPCITLLIFLLLLAQGTAWPYDYRFLHNYCPGPEWSVMCRGCCEYDVIHCKCPLQGTPVGYAVPCCRNVANECDPCIIHPGCSIFENCKRCNNGTWGPRDDFFLKGRYCAECRPGWSGGDCLTCGGVIHRRQGHLVLESYPTNARCEWTLKVDQTFTIDLRFMMLSLEFDYSCQYDYVEVRDGDSLNSRIIGRYCGNELPPPIRSTGNSLHILFVSDGYKNFDGFFAIFQESSACVSSPCFHDGTCIAESSHSFHCACLAGYTGKRCEHVLECRRPLSLPHGTTKYLDVRVGGHALFCCDPGYTLQGFQMATCLLDGSWSTPTPQCVSNQDCGIPPKPDHGNHFLVYGPNDLLIAVQFLCYKPYKLHGSPQRACLSNNTWSGMAPTCVKELDTVSEPENKQNTSKDKSTGPGEKGQAYDKTQKENEHAIDQEFKTQKPTSGKDNFGQYVDLDKDIDKVIRKELGTEKNKDKEENKETDSNINTITKEESDKFKDDSVKQRDNLDNSEKVDKSPTKGLDIDFVDIVLINSRRANNQTENDKSNSQKITDGSKYTILSFTDDNKENIFYEIDTINKANVTQSVDNNDIIENLETVPLTAATGSPEISTVSKIATTITVKPTEELKDHTMIQRPTEISLKDTKEESQPNKTEESEGRHCPPLETLYHGYYELVPELLTETVEFFCNHSYILSGSSQRTCQPNGTWTGNQPMCIKACREPKVSVLVKQRVLPSQIPSRKTAVHKFYSSSGVPNFLNEVRPTQTPVILPALPDGFHNLYTHIEYQCMSPYYKLSGSARRTCLRTGKWSGRHVSCSPVCGRLRNFASQHPAETNWPWLAAVYRLPASTKLKKHSNVAETKEKTIGMMEEEINTSDWQLVCSGALVNQRSVVVAAHCVTELGKLYPVDTSKIRVVLGKQYRSDLRMTKGLQQLRVSFITVHPNYDPLVLDSDVAVLKLLDKARIGDYVLPICLADVTTEDIRLSIVTGWSLLRDQKDSDMEKARAGHVMLGNIVPCEQQYANYGVPISVSENMLCGRQSTDADQSNICPADTGGVLILPPGSSTSTSPHSQASQEWKLLGLVSFGYDSLNCNPELYTVYTRITNFIQFIEENMK